jgi:hypothetical protein
LAVIREPAAKLAGRSFRTNRKDPADPLRISARISTVGTNHWSDTMQDKLRKLRNIANDVTLSPAQKARYLSLEAENMLAYPSLDTETQDALDERVICDMYEGHAPYKPRYVLPDYSVVMQNGSEYLELPAPETLDEAINTLMIAYHHVPSVTGMPVYIGQLDELLLPFCEGVSDETLYEKIKLFWRYLDRTLPDAFMHANIGPKDNRAQTDRAQPYSALRPARERRRNPGNGRQQYRGVLQATHREPPRSRGCVRRARLRHRQLL